MRFEDKVHNSSYSVPHKSLNMPLVFQTFSQSLIFSCLFSLSHSDWIIVNWILLKLKCCILKHKFFSKDLEVGVGYQLFILLVSISIIAFLLDPADVQFSVGLSVWIERFSTECFNGGREGGHVWILSVSRSFGQ